MLFELAVVQGLDKNADFRAYTNAPKYLVDKWKTHFFCAPEPIKFSENPTLVNKFTLGADPEFAFLTPEGKYFHAQELGMNTLLPFGCDMAGRQAELRAHSSRSVLEVVASMVDALRWIPLFYPATSKLSWVASPYIGRDGCGGHIHFGRKRPNRDLEIQILDLAYGLLMGIGVFSLDSSLHRRTYTKYGQVGDFRLQSHGYEYRALPTWMYSHWGAFFVITVCKLLLHHGVAFPLVRGKELMQVLNLLRLYRNVDDDAAIALRAWHISGLPAPHESCFSSKWGVNKDIGGYKNPYSLNRLFFPMSLPPLTRTTMDLFESLTNGTLMMKRAPLPSWEPFDMGEDFHSVTAQPHVFEIPNIAQGLVSRGKTVHIDLSVRADEMTIIGPVSTLDKAAIHKAFLNLSIPVLFSERQDWGFNILLPQVAHDDRNRQKSIRQILSNTQLFPICKGEDIGKVDWSRWIQGEKKTPQKVYGKIIYSVRGQYVKPAVRRVEEEF